MGYSFNLLTSKAQVILFSLGGDMDGSLKCALCGIQLSNVYYTRSSESRNFHLKCFLKNWELFKRSLLASVTVGSILIMLNQVDFVISGNYYRAMIWKIPLTYLVPFLVATWGAVMNSRVSNSLETLRSLTTIAPDPPSAGGAGYSKPSTRLFSFKW